ncbi:ABC transporter substrate-binding protein [Pelagibacterium halotolerans]|uniref:ABC transporter substrate-binding protein n=1 Tax=Pelagibacterium halotolerans TaxID=531813 RepID=UPI00384B46C9
MLKLKLLPMVTALVLFTGTTQAQSDAPFRLIVTHLEPPLVPNSVMDLAETLGYFDAEGVDVELVRVQQTPSALAALQAGEGEMANVGVDALLQIIAGGATDFRAVMSPNTSLPFLIAAKEEIATPEDLAGAVFGVGRVGSLDHALSTLVLDSLGVDIDETEIVTLGQPSVRAQALAAGQVDATTMSIGVWSELPDTSGLHVLVDQATYFAGAPVVNKVNAVSGDVLAERPEDVAAVIRAITRLSRDFANDPQLWVDAMAEARPDVDRDVLAMLAEAFTGSWRVNGGMSADDLAYTADWLYETEDFAGLPRLELDQWVAFGPVDAVLEELGVDDAMDPADR